MSINRNLRANRYNIPCICLIHFQYKFVLKYTHIVLRCNGKYMVNDLLAIKHIQFRVDDKKRGWAPSQYTKRRLFVRSRKVSKPRDWYFKLSYRFEIWQAHRQHCCRSACQISERSDNSKYKSRGFETLRDLTERRLFGYWDGALVAWFAVNRRDEHTVEGIFPTWVSKDQSQYKGIVNIVKIFIPGNKDFNSGASWRYLRMKTPLRSQCQCRTLFKL